MTQAFKSWHIIMISLSWTCHTYCGAYPTQYEPMAVSDFHCQCAIQWGTKYLTSVINIMGEKGMRTGG